MANIIQTFPTGAGGGSDIQVTSLPTASASELGKIYQYVGADTSSLTNGFFYECVEDSSTSPSTYDWAVKNVDEDETVEISKANFDLLTPAEKDNGKAYFIPDMDVVTNYTVMGNRFDKANIFTATERIVGSFLGKPLYQKTISLTDISISANAEVEIADLSSLSIDSVVDMQITGKENNKWFDFSRSNGAAQVNASDKLMLGGTSSWNFSVLFATIQYTKINDATVNIGTGNDYSTDEQIIGTWIDGKRLYQRVFTGTTPNDSNWTTLVTITDGNIITAYLWVTTNDNPDAPNVTLVSSSTEFFLQKTRLAFRGDIEGIRNKPYYVIVQYTKTTD